MKQASNLNLEDIITPVQYEVLQDLLQQSGYNQRKTDYLVNGFKDGFEIKYQGRLNKCKRLAPNLKLRIGSKLELWNKVMTEVELGCYAGPFEEPPFEHFVQSPI